METLMSAFSQLDSSEITIQRSRKINKYNSIFLQFLIPALILLTSVQFIRRNMLGAII